GKNIEQLMVWIVAKAAAECFRANRRKVSRALRIRRYRGRVRLSLAVPEALVIDKEESLVLVDGSAKRSAELVLLQRFRGGREIVGRVKDIVAQELPERSVKSVGAGAGNDISGRTEALSELGAGVVSQNLELGDGIHRRPENESSIHAVEVVGSINKKIVRLRPLAIDRIGLAGTQRSSRCLQTRGQWHNSGLKQAQLSKVAAVQRQVKHFAL